VAIRQPQVQHGHVAAHAREELADCGAGAAGDHVLLECHQHVVARGEFEHERLVERFDEAHVGHGGVDDVRELVCGVQQRAEGEQGDPGAASLQLPAPDRQAAGQQCRGLVELRRSRGA